MRIWEVRLLDTVEFPFDTVIILYLYLPAELLVIGDWKEGVRDTILDFFNHCSAVQLVV